MNTLVIAPLVIVLVCGAPTARADDSADGPNAPSAEPQITPPEPPPAGSIPAPPPPQNAPDASEAPPPTGQWTYTSQYGWLWMPYDQAYTSVYANSDVAYAYVYYPSFGWRWVSSPWVFGVGPAPYWGARGRVAFAWYAHPWFHSNYRFAYSGYHGGNAHPVAQAPARAASGRGFHGGGTFHGGGHGHR